MERRQPAGRAAGSLPAAILAGEPPALRLLGGTNICDTVSMSDEFQTLDQMIHGVYDSITFTKGTRPDWDRARSFFIPGAPMIRITPEAVVRMTIDSWIRGFEAMIDDGTFPSFYEGEIARRTERFGDIAHVFSTYETKYHAEDSALIGRGINSIQLYRRDGRWWISSMLWDRETKDKAIPGVYLRTSE